MTRFKMLIALVVTFAALASAQTFQAQLTGVIHDATGAVVPNANITATNQATGVSASTTSNDQGIFRLPALPPADYKVSVSLRGFKTVEQGPITLQVNDIVNL